MEKSGEILRMENITKTFPGVKALDDVQFDLQPGEVHTLMGENGAGKSTLMKIIAGVYRPETGKYFFEGKEVIFNTPRDAQLIGISIIYQEFNLIPHLSIAENIFLGREPLKRFGQIDWKKMYKETHLLLSELGVQLNPKEKINNLSIANKQMVEIAKALSFNSKVIIMDEPTAVLEDDETEHLFNIINDLKNKNVAVIYISHKMKEIFRISDRITVFRDGKFIKTMKASETDTDEIIKLMVGREINALFPEKKKLIGDTVLEVRNLSITDKFKNISFKIKRGEVLGVAGLMGCGKIDVGKAIFGYYPNLEGSIYINGELKKINSPQVAIQNKIALVSEDRKDGGLVLERNVKENITLASMNNISNLQVINHPKEKKIVNNAIDNLNIKVANVDHFAKTLSGGNQQKVVLAKWLETEPELFILLEPTRGIDIGSKTEIYNLINKLAEKGIAILYITSELAELVGMCDRVIVMHEGEISGEVCGEDITQEQIMYYSSGGKKHVG